MSIKQQIVCDVCGKHKQEKNHWWLIDEVIQFQVFTWSSDAAYGRNIRHICGQECAAKALSEWMQNAGR